MGARLARGFTGGPDAHAVAVLTAALPAAIDRAARGDSLSQTRLDVVGGAVRANHRATERRHDPGTVARALRRLVAMRARRIEVRAGAPPQRHQRALVAAVVAPPEIQRWTANPNYRHVGVHVTPAQQ